MVYNNWKSESIGNLHQKDIYMQYNCRVNVIQTFMAYAQEILFRIGS